MRFKSEKYRGYLFADMVVALSVLGFLLAGFAVSLDGFRRFNHYEMVRQRCIAAGQAQLDSISGMGRTVRDEDFERLWPELTVSIQESSGIGQWEGLRLLEVMVSGQSFNRRVHVKLSRYVLENKSSTGREQ